jgi:colicin import membrane protein
MTQLIIGILAIIVALLIIKKVVGCVARAVVIVILIAVLAILYATHANAQLFKPKQKPQESYTVTQDGKIKKRALFEKKPKAEKVIDPKYLAGACPEVNGKIQWQKAIEVPGKSADEIYNITEAFAKGYCSERGGNGYNPKTDVSKIAIADKEKHQVVARVQEVLTFENKFLSLDQAKFNYQLVFDCYDGRCLVTMNNLNYVYKEERENGAGQFPAEDLIADDTAINKNGDGFQKGGSQKFRTKTIDAKDVLFNRIEEAMK